jgi:hypothetical protein
LYPVGDLALGPHKIAPQNFHETFFYHFGPKKLSNQLSHDLNEKYTVQISLVIRGVTFSKYSANNKTAYGKKALYRNF